MSVVAAVDLALARREGQSPDGAGAAVVMADERGHAQADERDRSRRSDHADRDLQPGAAGHGRTHAELAARARRAGPTGGAAAR